MTARKAPYRAHGYIDDRALENRDEDRFHLGAIGDELADLVLAQRTPLNVAVFGPWGSGKSSLAVFLEQALSTRSKSTRFVRIDAWKYSKDSFRRQFIMESARTLGLDVERYRKKLYQKSTRSELTFPWEALGRLAGLLATFLAIVFGLSLLAGLVVSWIAVVSDNKAQFMPTFYSFMKGVAPSAVVSASVLAALFALMGKLFITDVTQSEVSSDEHFERVFKELVAEASTASLADKLPGREATTRIVFYIDELDRCASKDVVAVLEGIRTFLEVDNCVFVVSADNRVLELAVQQEAPHPVPDEEANPYYSSGAEYLDKLFQHQLAIPALLPHRLTSYALGLASEAGGVWTRATERGELANLVSVLVPSHVRSPRRVKVLLNGFVSLYEVAKARHNDDPGGTPNPDMRMLELAKLSTLRLEFPLFYRDLVRFPRLAAHLTAYELNQRAWPEGVEAEAKAYEDDELVRKYSDRERPADTMLSSVDEEELAESDAVEPEGDGEVGSGTSEIARRGELLSYLRKTANIVGPNRDVIFLEGAGSPYGIPGELADLVERDAVNNDVDALTARVQDLPVDQRTGVIHLLHETRRLMVGVEATNALAAAVRLVSAADLIDVADVADELVSDLTLESTNKPLPLEWLPAAVSIGLAARSPDGRSLSRNALSDPRLREEEAESLALAVLQATDSSWPELATQAADLLTRRQPGFIATALVDGDVSSSQMEQIALSTPLLDSLTAAWKEGTDESDLDDLQELSKCLRSSDDSSLDWTLAAGLAKTARVDLIDAWLAASPPIPRAESNTATLVSLAAAGSRERWPALESSFDEAPASNSVVLHNLVRRLFTDIDVASDDDSHSALRTILERSWGSPPWPKNWSSEESFDWVVSPDWSEGDKRMRKFLFTRDLARLDAQPAAAWKAALARHYGDLVQQGGTPADVLAAAGNHLPEDWALLDAETQASLIEAIQSGAGLTDDVRRLWLARVSLVSDEVPFPVDSEMVGDLTNGSDVDKSVVAMWLQHEASFEEVHAFIESGSFDPELYLAPVTSGMVRFTASEATSIAQSLVSANLAVDPVVYREVLRDVDEVQFAAWLAEELRDATNESERVRLMGIWAAWDPTQNESRRVLIGAYAHIAGSGKGGLELALRNIVLVRNPPKGTKRIIVDTLAARAPLYGLEKKAAHAMLGVGLLKTVRKGLFSKATVVTDDDD